MQPELLKLQLRIFCRIPFCFIYRILCFILFHLHIHDFICIKFQFIKKILWINKYICQFFFYMLQIILCITPLKRLQMCPRTLYQKTFKNHLSPFKYRSGLQSCFTDIIIHTTQLIQSTFFESLFAMPQNP